MCTLRSMVFIALGLSLAPHAALAQFPLPATGPAGVVSSRAPACRQELHPSQVERRPLGGTAFEYYRTEPWPGGVMPLAFDASIDARQRAQVFAACRAWSAGTGLRCVEHTTEAGYVEVRPSDGVCSSHVGRQRAGGATVMSLGPECWSTYVLEHEVGHAIGIVHEHQRADRDAYITVDLAQVAPGSEDQFTPIQSTRDHTPYDFASIMHYLESTHAASPGSRVLAPQPAFAGARIGGTRLSATDGRFVASVYGLGYLTAGSGRPGPPAPFRITTHEALAAMQAIDRFYRAGDGLLRPNGLSIGGRPDFLGLAAWFFDVYVATRYAGYEEADARYNVAAHITQSEEWRQKHPGWSAAMPLTGASRLPFTREELLGVMERLDRFYAAPEGLQRPDGLSIGGGPDLLGIANWVVEVYLGARLQGTSAESAWAGVEQAIRASDEWRAKH